MAAIAPSAPLLIPPSVPLAPAPAAAAPTTGVALQAMPASTTLLPCANPKGANLNPPLGGLLQHATDSLQAPAKAVVINPCVTFICKNGDTYVGQMQEGLFHGQGTLTYANDGMGRKTYEGQFVRGEISGKGKMTWEKGNTYTGFWEGGKQQGEGLEVEHDGSYYLGQWQAGLRDGEGRLFIANDAFYRGKWVKGEKVGAFKVTEITYTEFPEIYDEQGEMVSSCLSLDKMFPTAKKVEKYVIPLPPCDIAALPQQHVAPLRLPNGDTYVGCLKDGLFQGRGVFVYANNPEGRHTYLGEFVGGKIEGEGKMTWENGDTYTGFWKEGKPHGLGQQLFSDGSYYEGQWKKGVWHGKGVWFHSGYDFSENGTRNKTHGSFSFEGLWVEGKRRGPFIVREIHFNRSQTVFGKGAHLCTIL